MFYKKIALRLLFFVVLINSALIYTNDNPPCSLKEQFHLALHENPINVENIERILETECFYKNGMKVGCHNSALVNEPYFTTFESELSFHTSYFQHYRLPLITAIKNNDIRLLKLFMSYKVDINNQIDPNIPSIDDNTPLQEAFYQVTKAPDQIEIVNLLIDKGACINGRDSLGNAPLHKDFKKDIIDYLVNKGADINLQNNLGDTPLHCRVFNLVPIYTAYNASVISDNKSAFNNDYRGYDSCRLKKRILLELGVIKFLIKAGADLDIKNNFGETAEQLIQVPEVLDIFKQARIARAQKAKKERY